MKSKLETEKLEVIAIMTNLKLVNIKLTKENMELKKMLNNNQNTQNSGIPSYTIVSYKYEKCLNLSGIYIFYEISIYCTTIIGFMFLQVNYNNSVKHWYYLF